MAQNTAKKTRTERAFTHFKTFKGYRKTMLLRATQKLSLWGLYNWLRGKTGLGEEEARKHWNKKGLVGWPIQSFPDLKTNYLLVRSTLKKYPVPANAQIASVACGLGSQELLLAEENPGFKITGIDISERLLNEAGKLQKKEFPETQKRVSFHYGTFAKPNLQLNHFDFVISLDAFHWAEDWRIALSNMKQLIRLDSPSRLLQITYRPLGGGRMAKTAREKVIREMTPANVAAELESLGFEIKENFVSRNKEIPRDQGINAILAKLKPGD